ncbi:recombination regulator RecX [Betaproteobacteria bacterium SCN1]|jgi:regulatory protein|nr:recombination regulator RecX [Betaproteobacteria bacterium SCN1]
MKPKTTPDPASLRERALGYLARREHSRSELTRKLEAAGFASEAVEPVLDEFEEKGWLSDRRFAESWIADHRARHGRIRLAYDLRQRGVNETLIETALAANPDGELERARLVWEKKFGIPPRDPAEKARQMRFLQGRGFAPEIIRRAMGDGTYPR